VFESKFITNAINRSAENRLDRRRFLRAAGLTGVGVGAASLFGAPEALAADSGGPSDAAILNFALNLEYLEAEFYLRATTGSGLPGNLTSGTGTLGAVTGGKAVPFKDPKVKQYADEIAKDEKEHVAFLRTALGGAAVSRPAINLDSSFTAAAIAAGVIKPGETFDPYKDDQSFLWGAFIFEDVGVTAYKGAAPLINNKTYLSAAAGILAAEAYHASLIRSTLFSLGMADPTALISKARGSLDGVGTDDQAVIVNGVANIAPLDENGIAFGRTPGRVLNILYLTPKVATSGGFFPAGVNGTLNESGGTGSSAPPAGGNATGGSSGGTTGPGATPTGGAETGAGGASNGRNTELLVGSTVAAAGAIAAAHQHRKKVAADGASPDVNGAE